MRGGREITVVNSEVAHIVETVNDRSEVLLFYIPFMTSKADDGIHLIFCVFQS